MVLQGWRCGDNGAGTVLRPQRVNVKRRLALRSPGH